MPTPLSMEEAKELASIYLKNGRRLVKAAKEFGCSYKRARWALKSLNFFDSNVDLVDLKRKYTEVFPTNDTVLGYICGLIATDGSLDKQYKRITIGLIDRNVIQWLAKTTLNNSKAFKREEPRKYGKQSFFKFRSTVPRLYQYCLDMGITPNKSLTLDVKLDGKSEEFKWAFLRGVIDGDGSIYTPQDKSVCISICSGSLRFLETIQKYFGGNINQGQISKLSSNRNYRWTISGKKASNLAVNLPILPHMVYRKNKGLKETIKRYENDNS